jgi:hypothetical protein
MYVMTVEIEQGKDIDIQTVEVDQTCYEDWQQGRPDEAYHWMPAQTIAIRDVVRVDQ